MTGRIKTTSPLCYYPVIAMPSFVQRLLFPQKIVFSFCENSINHIHVGLVLNFFLCWDKRLILYFIHNSKKLKKPKRSLTRKGIINCSTFIQWNTTQLKQRNYRTAWMHLKSPMLTEQSKHQRI